VVKLSVRHTFPVPPDVYWQAFWDPALDDRMQAGTSVRRELLVDRTEGDVRIQRYRFTPEKTLPGPIRAIAGTDRIIYEQENRFDAKTGVLTWKVFPAILADKITAEGTFVVRAIPTGCERVVDGKIEVRVPFVGGKIESTIVNDVQAGYESAAKVTAAWLAEKAGASGNR
jgi:hypothetical protein